MSDVRATGQGTRRGIFLRHAVFQRTGFAFHGLCALLFAASAAMTVIWCASMSAMGEMPMPGGWTRSMAWLPMCGQRCGDDGRDDAAVACPCVVALS